MAHRKFSANPYDALNELMTLAQLRATREDFDRDDLQAMWLYVADLCGKARDEWGKASNRSTDAVYAKIYGKPEVPSA